MNTLDREYIVAHVYIAAFVIAPSDHSKWITLFLVIWFVALCALNFWKEWK